MSPFDQRCADALADEVDTLIRRGIIDMRSPAADALLDYRNPPSSPRSDRLAILEKELIEWKRGDVGRANLAMADRCIVAERETLDLRAKLAYAQSDLGYAKTDLANARAALEKAALKEAIVADAYCELEKKLETAETANRALYQSETTLTEDLREADAKIEAAKAGLEWADKCFDTLIEEGFIYDCEETTENRAPILEALKRLEE